MPPHATRHQKTVALALRCLLFISVWQNSVSHAQGASGWVLGAAAAQESIGLDLPVLALEQPDWPGYLATPNAPGRAVQEIKAEVNARHPSGWRVSTFVRAQAWLEASADAVTIGAAQALGGNPKEQRSYSMYAKSQNWSGQGITLGTPWWPVGTSQHWQWQADVSLLQLQRLRLAELGGSLTYKGSNAYDFDLWSQRSNTDITGRFLPPSGTTGSGASVSLAVQGQPMESWQVTLRGDDLLSTLQWNDLATDANTLQSANTTRRTDGYLDYAPYLKGKKSLILITSRIAPRYQLMAQRELSTESNSGATLTWQMARQAGINQTWIGWRSGPASHKLPQWHLALEPHWPAIKLEVTWRGWQLALTTDGRGIDSQFRHFSVRWQSGF